MSETQKREKQVILIVDDEENFREIMSAKLNAVGFDAATAANWKEAIKNARELTPDLILMDIHMPDATGTDLALAIKQDPATKDIKIAFLTSLKDPWPAMTGDRERVAKELGMEDFLDKTEDLDVTVEKIKAILARPR
ncbi:MAG: response regulator [Patescibacteria group bacterium]